MTITIATATRFLIKILRGSVALGKMWRLGVACEEWMLEDVVHVISFGDSVIEQIVDEVSKSV